MTIDRAKVLIRGQRTLHGVVMPQASDQLQLASGVTIYSLTSRLRGAWQASPMTSDSGEHNARGS